MPGCACVETHRPLPANDCAEGLETVGGVEAGIDKFLASANLKGIHQLRLASAYADEA